MSHKMETPNAAGLRKRGIGAVATPSSSDHSFDSHDAKKEKQPTESDMIFGRTPDGTVFTVPHTPDMLTSIFDPRQPKTPLDLLTLASLGLQIALYLTLSRTSSQFFFFFYFAFWRVSYNAGLGWVLKQQSERKWIIKLVKKHGWMDPKQKPNVREWIKQQLVTKMEKDYNFEALPLEYNVWLMFRSFVDLILLNDFVAYSLFAFSCFRLPEGHSVFMHVLRWMTGWALVFFNLWVKMDAHRVVKDYAWYWGDCFFLCLQSLVFDGVYEIAPDPMYSIGYAGYYGLSLVSGSYAVLFVSLAAHFAQFIFMCYFEGPHIDRTYGERKPIAARVPLRKAPLNAASRKAAAGSVAASTAGSDISAGTNPISKSANLGDYDPSTHSHTFIQGETDDDERVQGATKHSTLKTAASSNDAIKSRLQAINDHKFNSLHDLHHRIFRNDTVVFKNLDLMRANDFLLVVATVYAVVPLLLPSFGHSGRLALLYTNALAWRIFHSVGLGAALKAQSKHKWVVRHYLKHYKHQQPQDAVYDAFSNWKVIYNTSLVMTYASFGILCYNCYAPIGRDWTVGTDLLRHVLGLVLIALHVWTANSSYSVLGPFGWLYGDFFVDEYPHQLYYTGIYRFLNNPERSMGGAAFFGLTLISGSKLAFTMAILSYLAHWGFLSLVEGPHMKKLYGAAAVRKDSGVTKQLKSVAKSEIFKAAQDHPKIKDMQGTFEKVHRDATVAFEDFFNKNKPKIEGMLEDTKILLQQSRDRLLIVRVQDNLDKMDRSKYRLQVGEPSSSTGQLRFHLGEPIQVSWSAAINHSRRDWIGVYLVSRLSNLASSSSSSSSSSDEPVSPSLVTKISSQGKWLGVAEDEWDGDVYTGEAGRVLGSDGTASSLDDAIHGITIFKQNSLPWVPGIYEFRYHHDGKHNVLARSQPIEIYVDSPTDPTSFKQTYSTISKIVHYSNPTTTSTLDSLSSSEDVSIKDDPDDFTIWDNNQAKKIATAIQLAFSIELSPEVIVAEANIRKLATDVVQGRKLLNPEFHPNLIIDQHEQYLVQL